MKLNFLLKIILISFFGSNVFAQQEIFSPKDDNELQQGEAILDSKTPEAIITKNRICGGSVSTSGTDIFDGDVNMDWSQIKNSNVKFVFIKATQGITIINKLYKNQRDNAKAQNIVYAPYHFLNPADDPYLQAKFFLETVGEFDNTQLPPMLDWEISEFQSKEVQMNAAKIWLQEVEKATGAKPIIYTSPGFFDQFGKTDEFKDYPLFVANYDKTCPTIPNGWNNWVFWQKNIGIIQGIQHHKADLDVFNGSEEDLTNFIKQSWSPQQ